MPEPSEHRKTGGTPVLLSEEAGYITLHSTGSVNSDHPAAGVAADMGGVEDGAELDGAVAGAAEGFPTGAGAVELQRGQRDYGWHGRRRRRRRRGAIGGR